jgi:CHAD domain-containing protein
LGATAGGPTEVEWHLDAQDLRPVLRWVEAADGDRVGGVTIAAGHTVRQVDTYLDTKDRRLDRAGYSVRVRRSRRARPEATLKSLVANGSAPAGPLMRLEVEEPVDGEEAAAVAAAAGPVGTRVRALVGTRKLVPLFDVETRRRVFPLAADGGATGELVLDETAIREPGGRILGRLRRVEVEAPGEAIEALAPLVESLQAACGLRPALLSKYDAGLAASGLRRTQAQDLGATAVAPADTIGQVALAVLRRHFATLLAKEPGARLGEDIEALHEMRVASRRLRAAVALFEDALPADVIKLRPELGWVGQTVGAVRDLDVQLARLDTSMEALPEPDREPLMRLRGLLVDERERARADMLAALDSPRYERLVRGFSRALRTRTGTRTEAALAAAPDLVESRRRAVNKAARRIGPGAEPAAYHRLRIAVKRFRYALEFLAEVYPGGTGRLVRRTVAVQDVLGDYQDAQVGIERLRALADARGTDLGPATVFAMGEIAERYRRSTDGIRGRTRDALAPLDGKPWQRFEKRMEAERPRSVGDHPHRVMPRPEQRGTVEPEPSRERTATHGLDRATP